MSSDSQPSSLPPVNPGPAAPSSRTKYLGLTAGALAALALGVLAVRALVAPTPVESLQSAREAYAQHDIATFKKYVDAERVIGDVMDQTLDFIAQRLQFSPLQYVALKASVEGIKVAYAPRLAARAEQFFIGADAPDLKLPDAAAGSHGGTSQALLSTVGNSIKHVVAFAISSQLSYRGVVSSQTLSRDTALVTIKVTHPFAADPVALTLKMERSDRIWRVVGVSEVARVLEPLLASQLAVRQR